MNNDTQPLSIEERTEFLTRPPVIRKSLGDTCAAYNASLHNPFLTSKMYVVIPLLGKPLEVIHSRPGPDNTVEFLVKTPQDKYHTVIIPCPAQIVLQIGEER